MNNTELKTEVNELIDSLVVDGDRKGIANLIEDLDALKEIASDRLTDLGGVEDDEFDDTDSEADVPSPVEVDDGEEDWGDDLGDGVNDD
jgi:hypothetical protein